MQDGHIDTGFLNCSVQPNQNRIVRFGPFEFDPVSGELLRQGVKRKLRHQASRLLAVLLSNAGEIVTRDQMETVLWPDGTVVDFETAINKSVCQLRAALGDNTRAPKFIETIPKRGYRLIGSHARAGEMSVQSAAIKSVLVLPFENLTGSPEQAFLADGVVETLITRLGSIEGLRVISRTTAMACSANRTRRKPPGRDMGVDAVVEGAVTCSGTTLRFTLRLIQVAEEHIVWQGKYDGVIGNVLALYDEAAEATAARLSVAPSRCANISGTQAAVAPEAYVAYLKGRYLWNRRGSQDVRASIAEFQRALSLSPDFALAHAGLADAYVLLGVWGLETSHTAFGVAKRAAQRALDLDGSLAAAHCCMAEVLKDNEWNWSAAESEFQRALHSNANYATAHHWYSQLLVARGRFSEAIAQIELARRTDPLSPAINAYVPYIYLASRDYRRALEEARSAVLLDPYSALAHWQLGRAALFCGMNREAVNSLETASHLAGQLSMWQAELCFARATAGDRDGSEEILHELIDRARFQYVSAYDIAVCLAGLDNRKAALDHLEQAYEERLMRVIALGDPEFEGLREEPRFASLVQRLGLVLTARRKLAIK